MLQNVVLTERNGELLRCESSPSWNFLDLALINPIIHDALNVDHQMVHPDKQQVLNCVHFFRISALPALTHLTNPSLDFQCPPPLYSSRNHNSFRLALSTAAFIFLGPQRALKAAFFASSAAFFSAGASQHIATNIVEQLNLFANLKRDH